MQETLADVDVKDQRVIRELRTMVGNTFDFEVDGGAVRRLEIYQGDADASMQLLLHLRRLRSLEFFRRQLGRSGLSPLQSLTELKRLRFEECVLDEEGLASLVNLRRLKLLSFSHCDGISEGVLKHLSGLPELERLVLTRSLGSQRQPGSQITVATLQQLTGLKQLRSLNLNGYEISDAGLKQLSHLPKLEQLDVSGAGLTDAGSQSLEGSRELKYVHLSGTRITPAGVAALRARLPKTRIRSDAEARQAD